MTELAPRNDASLPLGITVVHLTETCLFGGLHMKVPRELHGTLRRSDCAPWLMAATGSRWPRSPHFAQGMTALIDAAHGNAHETVYAPVCNGVRSVM